MLIEIACQVSPRLRRGSQIYQNQAILSLDTVLTLWTWRWRWTAPEQVVNQIRQVSHVNRTITVNVTLFETRRRRTTPEQVVDQVGQISNIDGIRPVSVNIASNRLYTATPTDSERSH